MSDATLRELERAAPHDPIAREALWHARVRLGLGWSGERLPEALVPTKIPGLYCDSRAGPFGTPRERYVFVPATLEVRPFYVTNYPVLSGRFPAIGSRPTVSEPWRLPTKLEAARLMEEAPGHERPAHLVFAFGPGPHSCVNASGDPLRPRGGARCGRVFATAERPHGVGPFDLLGNVWEWDSEGGLYGGLARNRTGGFRLVVDAVA